MWELNMVPHVFGNLKTVYSEFGRQINVHVPPFMDQKTDPQWFDWRIESPYWTSESSESPTTVYAHLLPNESHNFMAIILCFQRQKYVLKNIQYSVKNTTSGFIWSSCYPDFSSYDSVMVIVPKSIFSVTDDDHRIELTTHDDRVEMIGIHLLQTESVEPMVQIVYYAFAGAEFFFSGGAELVYSEFGHQIDVHVSEFMDQKTDPQWFDWRIESPYWTSESSESSEYPESTTTVSTREQK
ncbi:hypothetical protein POM88_023605 [Heracleum sosnowskyi]|uniref:Uncharacterized protein n=1 Tax=Heracleum sosnowskyi TaxID=360622 RepID=A0AAD8IL30_9APIA|nr:hypothetical protein POM88_023605 [Heracleum sosnowskyi]